MRTALTHIKRGLELFLVIQVQVQVRVRLQVQITRIPLFWGKQSFLPLCHNRAVYLGDLALPGLPENPCVRVEFIWTSEHHALVGSFPSSWAYAKCEVTGHQYLNRQAELALCFVPCVIIIRRWAPPMAPFRQPFEFYQRARRAGLRRPARLSEVYRTVRDPY